MMCRYQPYLILESRLDSQHNTLSPHTQNSYSFLSQKCFVVFHYLTDTMGRMHSDAQFAGSSSVKPCGLFLLRTSAIQTSLIALGLSSVPAHVEMMGFLGIGNNPMVGCTVACAVDVATALNK